VSATRSAKPRSRPFFTHDRDGLKHTAADRCLADGKAAMAKNNEIIHVIIAFNQHDARELDKLGNERLRTAKNESAKVELSPETGERGEKDESAIIELSESAKVALSKTLQIERDRPFAEAVRDMFANLEDQTNLSNLRYVMAVHRHTAKTHVHLILRRQYTDKETGEQKSFGRHLPPELLNGRDERGRAKSGLLDQSLSEALDKLIPQRQRPAKAEISEQSPAKLERKVEARPHDPDLNETSGFGQPKVQRRIHTFRFKAVEHARQETTAHQQHVKIHNSPDANSNKANQSSKNISIRQDQSMASTIQQQPTHLQPATQINSSLTARSSDETQKREIQKRSFSRGR
jgi:hypothetical protein